MELFRISDEKYASKLSSSGIAGRWNEDNEYVIYTASSRSLGTLEKIIRFKSINPKVRYKVMVIFVPDEPELITEIKISKLPSDWREISAYPVLKSVGSKWYTSKETLILKVPSSIITKEFNYIINTRHPHFNHVKLISKEDYFFDERLIAMNISRVKTLKGSMRYKVKK
jgi:RES domain-containing protein